MYCISCVHTTKMADACLASWSGLLCIRWSTVSARAVDLMPLRRVGLLVRWPVREQGTFIWAFQATRGQQGLLGCSSTPAEKVKFLLLLSQNFQVGKRICPTSAQDSQALPSQPARRESGPPCPLYLFPALGQCMKVLGGGTCLAASQICPALLEWDWGRYCLSSNTCGPWWDVEWTPISVFSPPVRPSWSGWGGRRRSSRQNLSQSCLASTDT